MKRFSVRTAGQEVWRRYVEVFFPVGIAVAGVVGADGFAFEGVAGGLVEAGGEGVGTYRTPHNAKLPNESAPIFHANIWECTLQHLRHILTQKMPPRI